MRVIIVDDAAVIRESLSALLEANGLEVVASVPDAPTALEAVAEYHPDVAIVDLRLPGGDGDSLAHELLVNRMVSTVVMMSVDSSREARQRAANAGATLFVDKCHDMGTLGRELRQLFQRSPIIPVAILEQAYRV